MRNLLALLELKGGYLFQARPDLFPEGYLTDTELALWNYHYGEKAERAKQRG